MDFMGIIEKVQGLLLTPNDTLPKMKEEKQTMSDIIMYVCVLAVIMFVAYFIGFGIIASWHWISGKLIIKVLFTGIFLVALFVGAVVVVGYIIDMLAPNFEGKKDIISAMKTSAALFTPFFIAGILFILMFRFPWIRWIFYIVALYGVFILYLALPIMMENPEDKTVVYTVVTAIAAFGVSILVFEVLYPRIIMPIFF